jgi:hypothetical protein
MGLTLSDINRKIYYELRAEGLSHSKTMKKFPKSRRKEVLTDLNKTFFESHFGFGFCNLFK